MLLKLLCSKDLQFLLAGIILAKLELAKSLAKTSPSPCSLILRTMRHFGKNEFAWQKFGKDQQCRSAAWVILPCRFLSHRASQFATRRTGMLRHSIVAGLRFRLARAYATVSIGTLWSSDLATPFADQPIHD